MSKVNCWEYTSCGREIGGSKVVELGVCPAATFTEADNYLGGKNGGRACVYVTGTFCSGTIQGTHKEKEKQCNECSFYADVRKEHPFDMSVNSFLQYIRNSKKSA